MVTNVELAKEVDEKKRIMDEKTRILDEAIEEMKEKLKEVVEVALMKEDGETSTSKGKKKVYIEDEVPEPNPPLGENDPFIKVLKTLGGKSLESIQMFHGKMDVEVVLEWIESIKNHFEY